MRTTLNLDDDVLDKVKEYASSRSLSLGDAVGDLVKRALSVPRPTRELSGLQVFDLPEDSPRVNLERVGELDSES